MESKARRVYKFFLPWQDETEEAWLREMAQHGWHLSKAGSFGSYTFAAGEPRDDVYRLDYRGMFNRDLSEYLQLFEDAGWEHAAASGGWHYFRKPAKSSGSDELFTDNESRAGKYRRIMIFMVIPLLAVIDWLLYPGVSRNPALLTLFYILHTVIGLMFVGFLIRIRSLKRM